MGPIPLLNVLGEGVGNEVGLDGLIGKKLPRIHEEYVVGHVLADRGEVDTSIDTQTLKFCRIPNSGEHEKLWSAERPCAQNDLFASGHFPSFTWYHVNERTHAIVDSSTYWRARFQTQPY